MQMKSFLPLLLCSLVGCAELDIAGLANSLVATPTQGQTQSRTRVQSITAPGTYKLPDKRGMNCTISNIVLKAGKSKMQVSGEVEAARSVGVTVYFELPESVTVGKRSDILFNEIYQKTGHPIKFVAEKEYGEWEYHPNFDNLKIFCTTLYKQY